jgi:outer membrane protein assembly factor BamE (lipoprotein component of BamABCDE complex)
MRRASVPAIALVLAGCLPVPIPPLGVPQDSRTNLPTARPGFIREGQTQRADVLLALGAPDRADADERWFAYSSAAHQGGVAFVVGGYGSAAGVLVEGYLERRLIVRFDEHGIVEAVEFEEKVCPRVGLNEHGASACLDLVTLDLSAKGDAPPESALDRFERVLWLRSGGCIDPANVGTNKASPATAFRGTLVVTERSLVFTGRRIWTLFADDAELTARVPFSAVAGLALSKLGHDGALDLLTAEGLCYHIVVEGSGTSRGDTEANGRLKAVLEERLGATARPQ